MLSYGLFITTEYAVWISMLVFAYLRGGAKEAGFVAIAQLLPGAFVAPMVSTVADRHPPVRLLTASYAAQGAGMLVAAVLIWVDGPVLLIYAAAVVASTAIVAIRPAQAPLVPALATSTADLTAANIALGWIESLAVVAGRRPHRPDAEVRGRRLRLRCLGGTRGRGVAPRAPAAHRDAGGRAR